MSEIVIFGLLLLPSNNLSFASGPIKSEISSFLPTPPRGWSVFLVSGSHNSVRLLLGALENRHPILHCSGQRTEL